MSDVRIPINGREGVVAFALVDEADAERIGAFHWHMAHRGGYAATTLAGEKRGANAYMHRMVLGLTPGDGKQVDHINRDRLDNRRSNLRVGTHALNQQNKASKPGTTSQHRGVSFDKAAGCWRATVKVHGRQHFLGRYTDELEAARVAAEYRALVMPFSVEEPDRLVATG